MRIAFLDSWIQQVAEGSGTAAAIGGLGYALRKHGHHVARISPPVMWPPNLTLRRLLFNLYVPALLRALPYDLIVGVDIDGVLVAGRVTSPYVCSIKGVIAEELQHERGNVRRLLWLLSRLERINARRAPLVITTSVYCRRSVQHHYGVPEERIRIVPEGIDLAAWPQPERRGDGQTILCVARQYPRKHIADLIRAFAQVRRQFPQARLVIIGDGPEHANLRALAAGLDLNDACQLLGALPNDDDVKAWYYRADLFCLPSVQEGFGIVFLEAMAAGLPIVATTAAAIPEVVPHGEAGLLVPPGDIPALASALSALLADPALRQRYGEFGRAYVDRFDWMLVAERFLTVTRGW
ncbi:glycosyltransferase family 4 protein [Chloroflexus sp.]|uniref:glycosyltransferase family 4 protein n=1 Tax=Chloroflexus sp. TaxID=1904827 RepID=UPI00263318D5|nr:glycosyltransferase family 4 protein [uncultured Chloroflexus sp.]